ncbi:MAG: type II secretion system F family protein [SAR324 cluster bacterium]|nr:type II secretion system F family protein [SAR324 cluster bacterium]
MRPYFWTGKNTHGHSVEGTLECETLQEGRLQLNQKDIFDVQFFSVSPHYQDILLTDEHLLDFLETLSGLLASGMDLLHALEFIIRYHKNTQFRFILSLVSDQLRSGKSMGEAFQTFACFPPMLTYLIQVGEVSGHLPDVLRTLIEFYTFRRNTARERSRLLRYPLMVLGVGTILVLGILIYIIPRFKRVFSIMGDDLFWLTQIMVSASNTILNHPLAVFCGSLSLLMITKYLIKWLGPRVVSLLPSGYWKNFLLLTYSRSMSIMLHSGVPLTEAIRLTESLFPEAKQHQIHQIHRKIFEGETLESAYRSSSMFTQEFVHLVALGESSGYLASSFERIAAFYQNHWEKQTQRWTLLLEPLVMTLLSTVIFMVLLSIYLPVFKMAEYYH